MKSEFYTYWCKQQKKKENKKGFQQKYNQDNI